MRLGFRVWLSGFGVDRAKLRVSGMPRVRASTLCTFWRGPCSAERDLG